MNLEVTAKEFNWLVDLQVLRHCPAYKQLQNGKIALDEKTTHRFETGHKFMEILKQLNKVRKKVVIPPFPLFYST